MFGACLEVVVWWLGQFINQSAAPAVGLSSEQCASQNCDPDPGGHRARKELIGGGIGFSFSAPAIGQGPCAETWPEPAAESVPDKALVAGIIGIAFHACEPCGHEAMDDSAPEVVLSPEMAAFVGKNTAELVRSH
jgi:hypothetical protein